jgi:hypothetical protein
MNWLFAGSRYERGSGGFEAPFADSTLLRVMDPLSGEST